MAKQANEVDIKIYYKYKKCIANELKAIFQVLLNLCIFADCKYPKKVKFLKIRDENKICSQLNVLD